MGIIKEQDLQENKVFLDNVATETMKIFIQNRHPQKFGDSVQVARIAYRQALAMLQTKMAIKGLLKEVQNYKSDGRQPIRSVEDGSTGGDSGE